MAIPNANFGVVALVDELFIQCRLIEVNGARLEDAADHWIKMERGEDFDRKVPPLDILAWCTVCLAAMGATRRLLFAGANSVIIDRRRAALQDLLSLPPLPSFTSATVRNAWEHLDERLDERIPLLTAGSLSHIHVAGRDPSPGELALKRFDPRTLTIYFAEDGVALRPAIEDAATLSHSLDAAMVKLQTVIVRPWG